MSKLQAQQEHKQYAVIYMNAIQCPTKHIKTFLTYFFFKQSLTSARYSSSTYIHCNFIPLGCFITHTLTQKPVLASPKSMSVVQVIQQPIAPTWSRKGGSFSGLTEGTRMPQVMQLNRTIAGVCYPRALLPKPTQTSRPCWRHVDNSKPFSKIIFFPKNTTRAIINYVV